jgi:hypothetical protein
MIVVPAVTPVTIPAASIVATAGVPLDHVPPETVLESVTVRPVHTLVEPEIVPAVGAALIVTGVIMVHPVASV